MEIVKLIGSDVLPDDQKLVIEIAKRHPGRFLAAERLPSRTTPMFPLSKQFLMMKVILTPVTRRPRRLIDRALFRISRNHCKLGLFRQACHE